MSPAPPQINVFSFDYDGVPAVKAAALRAEAGRIRKLLKATVPTIIEVGRSLIEVKAQLDHGKFGAECGFSLSSAENYMRVAERFGDKIATVANLSPTTVYRLAKKSTPPSIVEAALQRAAKGDVISDDCVAVALDKAKFERQQAAKRLRAAKRRAETIKQKKLGVQNPFVDFEEDGEGDDEQAESTPTEKMNGVLLHSDTALGLAKWFLAEYDGPVNDKVLEAARATASVWCQVLEKFEQAKPVKLKRAVG
ncbi:DUF3102 domain-containing protein [Bradyrhizobium sp. JYMT SZCCT0428]|uniref:DUF3102 domain-containing protein n=1 Tax=Bradyrhizobium sp. JYMT SZCCT0428 TaxID=2807673 RepID=UPI001BAC779C|nr:DUF3102 domain-containing protein [Bradyrhizobium sp. JYMT SZCCT0428]MBR1149056.1 DUF3102 domain-containing protein [Bradyrhizobium sp. JYMT SZCCT0428]